MIMNAAKDVYNAIGEEIQKYQTEIEELKVMAAYADSEDSAYLRTLMNSRRDLIAGLEISRSIAYRVSISPEAEH